MANRGGFPKYEVGDYVKSNGEYFRILAVYQSPLTNYSYQLLNLSGERNQDNFRFEENIQALSKCEEDQLLSGLTTVLYE